MIEKSSVNRPECWIHVCSSETGLLSFDLTLMEKMYIKETGLTNSQINEQSFENTYSKPVWNTIIYQHISIDYDHNAKNHFIFLFSVFYCNTCISGKWKYDHIIYFLRVSDFCRVIYGIKQIGRRKKKEMCHTRKASHTWCLLLLALLQIPAPSSGTTTIHCV